MNPESATPNWYVVQTQPRRELLAATALETSLDLDVFLPEVEKRIHGQKRKTPLFPGYCFVSPGTSVLPVRPINGQIGVLRLVAFDGEARCLSDDVIQALRRRVDTLNGQGGLPRHSFRSGDAVRLTGGPLAGLEAVFQQDLSQAERVQVLLTFLGREQTATVDVGHLEKSSHPVPAPIPHPPRRTRGRGRRIQQAQDL